MLYALACLVLLVLVVYWICNSILKVTGWSDPKERSAATIAVMTTALLNSDQTPKKKYPFAGKANRGGIAPTKRRI